MPTRHDVERPGDLAGEQAQDHWIAWTRVIGGPQHAGAGIQRRLQAFRADAFPRSDAERFAKVSGQIPLDDSLPERTESRRDEAVGFGDDNVLHRYGSAQEFSDGGKPLKRLRDRSGADTPR